MTPSKQRLIIAELCGLNIKQGSAMWTRKSGSWNLTANISEAKMFNDPVERLLNVLNVPNYLNDLNACAKFEKSLANDEIWPYERELANIVSLSGGLSLLNYINDQIWHASALQRCEAFLRLKGKWEEQTA